jgi:GDP-4-dehydro-6-deoxy-D-mannose reductase
MTRPRAFITGILGFAGSYLAEELLAAGYAVSGSRLGREPLDNVAAITGDIDVIPLDILNAERCRQTLKKIRPDYVFHLAAMASVGQSLSMERKTLQVNVEGTLNMLDAAREVNRLKGFVFVSSPDCYGLFTPKTKTLTEQQPLNPISPYGISKAAAERLSLFFHRQHGLPVRVARAFNHTGPRQEDRFVVPSFAKQIAEIEVGRRQPVIKVGNLSARRDLSDVRDIVKGYRLLAERGTNGEVYQFCSGKAISIKSVLESLLRMAERTIRVETDPARMRKSDIPVLRGSFEKARRRLGFVPDTKWKTTLSDTLSYWRVRVQN